jgi:hypothetical protein
MPLPGARDIQRAEPVPHAHLVRHAGGAAGGGDHRRRGAGIGRGAQAGTFERAEHAMDEDALEATG